MVAVNSKTLNSTAPPDEPPPAYDNLPEAVEGPVDGRPPSRDPRVADIDSYTPIHPVSPQSTSAQTQPMRTINTTVSPSSHTHLSPSPQSPSLTAPIPVVTREPRTSAMSASDGGMYNPLNPRGLKTQPIYALQGYSSCIECPQCGHVGLSRVEKVTGSKTHLWAGLACVLCCMGCIPYLIDSCKDTHHFCKGCNQHIFSYKN